MSELLRNKSRRRDDKDKQLGRTALPLIKETVDRGTTIKVYDGSAAIEEIRRQTRARLSAGELAGVLDYGPGVERITFGDPVCRPGPELTRTQVEDLGADLLVAANDVYRNLGIDPS